MAGESDIVNKGTIISKNITLNEEIVVNEELVILEDKKEKIACCRSYLTPKGRCYDCVEETNSVNPLNDSDEHTDVEFADMDLDDADLEDIEQH